jgi:hypothetical protein
MLTKPWPVEGTESRERRVCVASLDDVELIIVLLSSIDNTSRFSSGCRGRRRASVFAEYPYAYRRTLHDPGR